MRSLFLISCTQAQPVMRARPIAFVVSRSRHPSLFLFLFSFTHTHTHTHTDTHTHTHTNTHTHTQTCFPVCRHQPVVRARPIALVVSRAHHPRNAGSQRLNLGIEVVPLTCVALGIAAWCASRKHHCICASCSIIAWCASILHSERHAPCSIIAWCASCDITAWCASILHGVRHAALLHSV